MRNLKNVYWSTYHGEPGDTFTALTWDITSETLICATGPSKPDGTITIKRSEKRKVGDLSNGIQTSTLQTKDFNDIASWDAPSPNPDLEHDEIVNLKFFVDTQTICIVLAGGDIIVVREEPTGLEDKIEIVGSVDAGITAAEWSPDEELLAICTNEETMLFMTRDYEGVVDIGLSAEDFKTSRHVSVGWGKVETQFKGKRAKALRDPTVPEHVDEGLQSTHEDGKVSLSWRGDGAYVALSTLSKEQGRVIRVYSREGSLDSVSEPVNGLEQATSWRPAGNLIASIQRLKGRIDVVFFERNGLRHGQFPLRLTAEEFVSPESTVDLKWNVDSSILAIILKDQVQLWTMGNYHYYQKQTLELPSASVGFCWHPEKPLLFGLITQDTLQMLRFSYLVDRGSPYPPHDYGIVAVIDGNFIKLTPLRLANVPPPMSWQEIKQSTNIIGVATSVTGSFLASLDSKGINVYKINVKSKSKSDKRHQLLRRIDFVDNVNQPVLRRRQITFLDDNSVCTLCSTTSGSLIQGYNVDSGDRFSEAVLTFSATHFLSRSDHDFLYLQSEAGAVFSCVRAESNFKLSKFIQFPMSVGEVQVIYHKNEQVAFGLSASGTLYANQRVVARNCTSFLLAPAHLIFTTAQHLLKFIHLGPVEELEVPPDDPEKDERCRSIERGAKLVAVMPTSFSLTLQMPRGNLETIYPRALVLAGIRRSIEGERYKAAFLACRNQRVDMNIIHDHAPDQFISNVGLFVDQIEKSEHIDLFLSQLREEDVSKTMYKETSTAQKTPKSLKAESDDHISKINRICNRFLEILQTKKSTNLLNLITAHVCKSPPDLGAGLQVIDVLRKKDPTQVERAVEHICFLADINKLYEAALGLHNLDIALLVAQQSQMDPREYLPFLRKVQEMEHLRRRFFLDDYLGLYSKALFDLKNLDSFEELQAYVVKHTLYQQGLKLYRYQEKDLQQILALYADHLKAGSKFKAAGIAYESLKDFSKAAEAYAGSNCWREALYCASQASYSDSQIHNFALSQANGLYEVKDYFSSATIHLDYIKDVPTAAKIFCKGYHFAEAIRIVCLHRRIDLLESVIDTGLTEGLASSTELLAECKGQLNAQVPRLRDLRVKKDEDPLNFYDGPANDTADIPDNVSLAASNISTSASLFTRYTARTSSTLNSQTTHRTSKNRKREERKRARGKKGSVYEEGYLVNSVGRLIERVNSVGDEVRRLIEGLYRRGMREQARAVESAMEDVVGLCRGCVAEVFEVKEEQSDDAKLKELEGVSGGDRVLLEEMAQQDTKREAPFILDFERLSLLGK